MKEYQSKLSPDKNVLTLFDTDVLVEVANGRIDLNEEAIQILKNRGLDINGKWVGYNHR